MINHVTKGQSFQLSAKTFNEIADATNDFLKKKAFGANVIKHNTDFYIKNKTGKQLPIYSVVMVDGIENDLLDTSDTAAMLNEFIGVKLVFTGKAPDKNSKNFDKICIIQQPLAVDEIGVGIVDGLSKCYGVTKESDNYNIFIKRFLRAEHDNTDYLLLSNFGNLEVFFIPSDNIQNKTEDPFLMVANIGATAYPSFFPVNMRWKSGGDGETAYEPRIYDIVAVADIFGSDVILKPDVDPSSGKNQYRRPIDFNVTKATQGLAYFSPEENEMGILIAWCNEYPMVGEETEVMP